MLLEHIALLNSRRILLASQSPRRKAILNQLGLQNFEQIPSGYAEDLDSKKFTPKNFAMETARHKAVDVWNLFCARSHADENTTPDLVLAADTVVVLGDEILGKPATTEDACVTLRKLSGTSHQVVTGCALCYKEKSSASASASSSLESGSGGEDATSFLTHTFAVAATVHFAVLSESEIQAYVATGEPMDKAGKLFF